MQRPSADDQCPTFDPLHSHELTALSLSLSLTPINPSLLNSISPSLLMAEMHLDAVLQFLRRNGLSASESALFQDITDQKSTHGGAGSPEASSDDDEFVSFGSSDFTNPYAIHTTRPGSQASSDRLSQFGTARDSRDFDMQNDALWYKEDDGDYVMPPLFDGRDFDGDPSEDKFVMSMQAEEPVEDETKRSVVYEGRKRWGLDFEEHFKCEPDHDCDEVSESFQLEKVNKECDEYCDGVETVYTDVCKEESPTKAGVVGVNDTYNIKKESRIDDDIIGGASLDTTAEGARAIPDELLTYEKEDDYEIFDLRIVHRKNRTGFEENKEFPIVLNSVIAGRYHVTEVLGSAAFSRVVQARDLHSGIDVCLKIIKNDKDFFDQSLDEIKLLKFVNRNDPADERHILRLYDYFYHQEHLFIVTELLRANLYEFQKYNRESGAEPYFTMHRLQVIIQQCLEALVYLHDLGIVHCDLKPENILIKSYRKSEIKVIDLGSSCFQTDNPSLYVQSRSYRAPEVMLGLPYDHKIDLWSLGCILAELYSGEVLFPNEEVVLLLVRMVAMLGPIDAEMLRDGQETHKYFTREYDLYYIDEETNEVEYIIPEEMALEEHLQIPDDPVFVDFMKCLLEINPARRPSAREALKHPWLSQI
ncbi:dual specificity tyrosine-phosphorylation-regulated kinase 2-like [Salvia splendens]|uniref:dual specificity tyrosine-phosphorylation-regulated kinase 2-like n=1 Tax=Salvia splendens TaxID=180675 RepID=UPI0011003903|nr:dual specificity tyrosine-phosphorylation-regulated kinase 2-like [Salvia splendens]